MKQAAAQTNMDLGVLMPSQGEAIVTACKEIRARALLEPFVLDPIHGGAGTSTNMNANEVIANRALELLGHTKGDYQFLSPWNTSIYARAPTTPTRPLCASRPS
nr:lyase family protein [Pseudarthrobacter sp. NamE2]